MADVKISQLTELTTPTGNEELVYAYGGANGKIKLDNTKNVKVFTLSGTSDLVNAQAAIDWWNNGGVPVIKMVDCVYYVSTFNNVFIRFTGNYINNGGTLGHNCLEIQMNNGTVQSITETMAKQIIVTALPANPNANTIYFVK